MIKRVLKQRSNKAFFMMHCKSTAETEKDLTKKKKKHIKLAGCSFEKNLRHFTFFPVLENAGQINFKTFSRIQDYVSPVPRVKSRILDRGSDCSE